MPPPSTDSDGGTTEATASPAEGDGGRARNRRNNPRGRKTIVATPKFEGREPTLKGFVYDYTGERAPDQYIKTTKEIVTYVGRTYTKYTSDFTQAMEALTLVDPALPADPAQGDAVAFELWKLDIKDHRDKIKECMTNCPK